MQIWTPRRLEGSPSQHSKGLLAPSTVHSTIGSSITSSTVQSTIRSSTNSHNSHISPVTEESAIEFSLEKPGQPILVLYLSANEEGGNEMSFLTIESKLKDGRSGKT